MAEAEEAEEEAVAARAVEVGAEVVAGEEAVAAPAVGVAAVEGVAAEVEVAVAAGAEAPPERRGKCRCPNR